jgi:hypothetical protein
MRGRKQTNYSDVQRILWTLKQLRLCLEQMRQARCPQAAKAIARAIKSTDGARRHAERKFFAKFPRTGAIRLINDRSISQIEEDIGGKL